MIRVAIEGASGYVGGELLSLLDFHPEVEIVAATAGDAAGRDLSEVRPRLGDTSLTLSESLSARQMESLDALFLALPHGESSRRLPSVPRELAVFDLAADFRIGDRARAEATYGAHPAWELQADFVYGLPELYRNRIRESRRIAVPGCFATAAVLALLPALEADVLTSPPVVSAVTGSSGSGHRPRPATHHPDRALNFFAYQPLSHRHQPEIESALAPWNRPSYPLALQVHSAPLVRGIYATAFLRVDPAVSVEDVYRKRYRSESFVLVRNEPPQLTDVVGTPRAALCVTQRSEQAVVFCAIDNLLKGAAAQAVHCMNLHFRFPEDAGLRWPHGALP